MTFEPSPYQQAVFDFIENGQGNGLVNAVAGSGKTTTAVQAAQRLDPSMSALFVAFNKSIANELNSRLKGTPVNARTVHSLGMAMVRNFLGKVQVNSNRYHALTVRYAQQTKFEGDEFSAVKKLINLGRLNLTTDLIDLEYIADYQGIDYNPKIGRAVYDLVEQGTQLARQTGEIDFADMLYLPWRWELSGEPVDMLFADEAQDFSTAQLYILLAHIGKRALFIGDPKQCQPPDTKVRMKDGTLKNIEQLCVGDEVVTYDRRSASIVKSGKVTDIASRAYDGDLITVDLGMVVPTGLLPEKRRSRCTPNHKWLVRWTHQNPNTHAVYLMQKDNQWRLGTTQLFHDNHDHWGFGVGVRARIERADAAWILCIHDNKEQARIHEQILAGAYGLPQMVFNEINTSSIYTQDNINHIFDGMDAMTPIDFPHIAERAARCLSDFGRDMLYPLWTKEVQQRQGRSTLFETQACNLMAGYMAVPVPANGNKVAWLPIEKLECKPYSGDVYSLNIAKYHKYVADGIVTCNSIYGFAGADINAWDNMKQKLDATEMPLAICYRCAPPIIDLAKQLVPQIEGIQGRKGGTMHAFKRDEIADLVQAGDLVVGRLTAPLIEICLSLIGKRIAATVKGRDIGKALADLIDKVTYLDYDNDFLECLSRYVDEKCFKLAQKDNRESQIQALRDQEQSIEVCYTAFTEVHDAEMLKAGIQHLFSDDVEGVTLATIHRVKGLEANRVFIVCTDKLPLQWATQRPWQYEQELNLLYVAITRAKEVLFVENGMFNNGMSIVKPEQLMGEQKALEDGNTVEGEIVPNPVQTVLALAPRRELPPTLNDLSDFEQMVLRKFGIDRTWEVLPALWVLRGHGIAFTTGDNYLTLRKEGGGVFHHAGIPTMIAVLQGLKSFLN